MAQTKKIIIAGGGITGLSAAFYLQQAINKYDLPYELKLIEASSALGGKIKTMRKEGLVIERGPDCFLARKKPAVTLAEDLGIADQLVRNSTGQSYILNQDRLHKIPPGSFMGIPTQVRPFLQSDLFSRQGKARAGLDFILPRSQNVGDQSLGTFLRRRLGDEVVENSIEPLLSGIYSGDIDQMSLLATFPTFFRMENKYGSLIKGIKRMMPAQNQGTGKRPGQFFTLKNGLETMITELEKQIDKQTLHLNSKVNYVEHKEGNFHLQLSDGVKYEADAVLMTTPHQVLPSLFPNHTIFDALKEVPSTSVANVVLTFDQAQVKDDLSGTGFVVSRNSNYRITACTYTHKKWSTTTPSDKVMLRAYVGKPTDQEVVQLSDGDIIEIVLNDIKKIINLTGEPEFAVVTRWNHAMPQYTIGHNARILKLREKLNEYLPGLFVAGSSYGGVGIPDCIEQGKQSVDYILNYIREKSK